jgi:hypothetical protein
MIRRKRPVTRRILKHENAHSDVMTDHWAYADIKFNTQNN